ncbi:hypothetical protein [Escherichia coli]|uniref:hypothetical protein n=1 Tax=Escherichia coli TaxID=562 RepID=UPI0013CFD4B3|nr:hypothetical protein [Escherichia coli]MDY9503180.1 hypothetical protein [Escherichia coli]NGK52335.1 hypothetical protein [Escherichia coli]HBD5441604.1 hypothetical protein [Escherichia coli]HCQ3817659.1 hypothetical protein [Escherichia coli]HEB2125785.1 hypothetical protein [Escherichia coli]
MNKNENHALWYNEQISILVKNGEKIGLDPVFLAEMEEELMEYEILVENNCVEALSNIYVWYYGLQTEEQKQYIEGKIYKFKLTLEKSPSLLKEVEEFDMNYIREKSVYQASLKLDVDINLVRSVLRNYDHYVLTVDFILNFYPDKFKE